MNLIREVGETHVAHQLFTNDGRYARCVASLSQRRVRTIGEAIWREVAIAGGGIRVRHLRVKRKRGM